MIPHHTQVLGGSGLNSSKNLPKPAHTMCQVAIALATEKRKSVHTDGVSVHYDTKSLHALSDDFASCVLFSPQNHILQY